MTQHQGLRVEEGRIKVNHQGRDLIFSSQAYGPDTYANVQSAIEQNGLVAPTMAETAFIAHWAFYNDLEHADEIRQIMKDRWLWAFTGSLYTPNGVYVQDHPEIRGGMPFMEEQGLIKKLEANDSSVRFIPFEYQRGEMTSLQLAKNKYVIALAGEEGAGNLAEVADKHERKPYVHSLESVNEPTIRVSALDSYWDLGYGLGVSGCSRGGGRVAYAFGVQVAPQARAEK